MHARRISAKTSNPPLLLPATNTTSLRRARPAIQEGSSKACRPTQPRGTITNPRRGHWLAPKCKGRVNQETHEETQRAQSRQKRVEKQRPLYTLSFRFSLLSSLVLSVSLVVNCIWRHYDVLIAGGSGGRSGAQGLEGWLTVRFSLQHYRLRWGRRPRLRKKLYRRWFTSCRPREPREDRQRIAADTSHWTLFPQDKTVIGCKNSKPGRARSSDSKRVGGDGILDRPRNEQPATSRPQRMKRPSRVAAAPSASTVEPSGDLVQEFERHLGRRQEATTRLPPTVTDSRL